MDRIDNLKLAIYESGLPDEDIEALLLYLNEASEKIDKSEIEKKFDKIGTKKDVQIPNTTPKKLDLVGAKFTLASSKIYCKSRIPFEKLEKNKQKTNSGVIYDLKSKNGKVNFMVKVVSDSRMTFAFPSSISKDEQDYYTWKFIIWNTGKTTPKMMEWVKKTNEKLQKDFGGAGGGYASNSSSHQLINQMNQQNLNQQNLQNHMDAMRQHEQNAMNFQQQMIHQQNQQFMNNMNMMNTGVAMGMF